MNTVDLIINSATTFYNDLCKDPNGRYRSWEYCYKVFHDARKDENPDIDYLSLSLAFYLASWGMYRGSSFLLQKDYKVHRPVVEKILNPEYNSLQGIDCVDLRSKSIQDRLSDLNSFILSYYADIRNDVKNCEADYRVSDTLITKILMGTLGCVPAYDRYFISGVKSQRVTTGIYNINSLLRLVEFYEQNKIRLEEARKNLKVFGIPYPQMKMLDMGFWQIGFINENDRSKKAH